MSNKLAEDVLNKDMLFLVQCYSEANPDVKLESTIKFLEQTSVLTDIFRDDSPITSNKDHRLKKLEKVAEFFTLWETAHSDMSKEDFRKTLITSETREDLESMIKGFLAICEYRITHGKQVKPSIVNSDPIEELFSLQRALYNGNDTHPNVNMYAANINTCVICNFSVPKKCNVFCKDRNMKRPAMAGAKAAKRRALGDITNLEERPTENL
jgi:hypothetical protein